MSENASGIFRPFLIAVASVAAVFVLTSVLRYFIETDVSTLYLVAVIFASWRGGLSAGLFATVLSVALATYFFLPPIYSFSLKAEGVVELIVFGLAAALTSYLNAARERALVREQTARREAEAADQVKDEFIAAVSHELRTPLTTIKTLTSLLLRKSLPEAERREYLQDVASECDRQIDFVHNLLDLSRLKAGGVQINLQKVDPAMVLEACEKHERVSAAEHDHDLKIEIETNLPPITADPDALRRAVCAVTENAVKYTDRGGIIRLRARRDSADADHVLLEIEDNGRGIDAADLPRIFERFYRGRTGDQTATPDAQDVSGIGLGLHLARELVEEMNGTIKVFSRPGAGSLFTVRMPVWQPAQTAFTAISSAAKTNGTAAAEKPEEKI